MRDDPEPMEGYGGEDLSGVGAAASRSVGNTTNMSNFEARGAHAAIEARSTAEWFFFRVDNLEPSKEYRFNIVNFSKKDCLFSRGMRPVMFSARENDSKRGPGWRRIGTDCRWRPSKATRFWGATHEFYTASKERSTFSFSFRPPHAFDKLYFALAHPYTRYVV